MKATSGTAQQPAPQESPPWTAAELGSLLSPREEGRATLNAAVRNPLVQAAAVLSYFEPASLRPVEPLDEERRSGALRELLDNSSVMRDGDMGRWTLNDRVRRDVLAWLGSAGPQALRRARRANPAPEGARQRVIEHVLSGEPLDVENLPLDELKQVPQVAGWLSGVTRLQLPHLSKVQARIAREELLRPFRQIAGDHFRGRRVELDELRDYVGVVDPASMLSRTSGHLRRAVREVLSLYKAPPLFVQGPGGTGKSTLIAHFILEHAEAGAQSSFPFVYLDFDRPGLLGDDPALLLIEIAAQLEVQYPGLGFAKMRRAWSDTLIFAASEATHAEPERGFEASISEAHLRQHDWIQQISGPLNTLVGPSKPLVLALDTFEEVQYRSHAYVEALWAFLERFQAAVPRTRTVLAGRAPLAAYPTLALTLGDFDPEAARGFLEHQGIDAENAGALVKQLGGNPLSLKLAAEVVRLEGADTSGIRGLTRRRFLVLSVSATQIQGQLYDRILSHIHDPNVRQLAHPGLVLRRVTPQLITEVLAEPCGVDVEATGGAQSLFDEFAREVSLVSLDADGALRHRTDIRRIMLPLVRDAAREKVDEIHRRAVEFYSAQEGVPARAEEIYHRLSLNEDRATLEQRWESDVVPYLAGALEELPPGAHAYLAARMGVEVDPEVLKSADQDTWEADAERRVRELVKVGRLEHAMRVLQERQARLPASRLLALEATVLSRVGRGDEALAAVRTGLKTAAGIESGGTSLDLTLLGARLQELRKHWDASAEEYEAAAELALTRRDARLVWEGVLARLALHHAGLATEPLDVHAWRDRLVQAYEWLSASEAARYAGMLRCVAGELVGTHRAACLRIMRSVHLAQLSPLQVRAYLQADPDAEAFTGELPSVEIGSHRESGVHDQALHDLVWAAIARTLDASDPDVDELRAMGAALRAAGLPEGVSTLPAGQAGRAKHGLSHRHMNPPETVARVGRRLQGDSYEALVRQLDHGEVLIGLYARGEFTLSAPLLDSAQRLAEHDAPHLRLQGYYAVWLAHANRAFGFPNSPLRAVRLYPSTGVETITPV